MLKKYHILNFTNTNNIIKLRLWKASQYSNISNSVVCYKEKPISKKFSYYYFGHISENANFSLSCDFRILFEIIERKLPIQHGKITENISPYFTLMCSTNSDFFYDVYNISAI